MANYKDIIKKLINSTDVEKFSGADLEQYAQHLDAFWTALADYLQNEGKSDYLGHHGIRDIDFDTSDIETIVEFINDNADLIDSFLDNYLKKTEDNPKSHWNESLNYLFGIYRKFILDQGEIDSTHITVADIVSADAGNSFSGNNWVRPWFNIDEKIYAEVRGNDKIRRVLDDESFLQFTREIESKYLRLLMPEYQRVVEVEDLDRNFWVIGQVLTGICAYLFEVDSPLKDLLRGMLDEVAQLWENMLYLWLALAITSQLSQYKEVETIVVPLSRNKLYPYVKFDDFGNEVDLTDADKVSLLQDCWVNHLSHIKKIYTKSSLVIIPEIRTESYQKNYYNKAYYPGAIVLNRRYRSTLDVNSNDFMNISTVDAHEIAYYPFSIGGKDFIIDVEQEKIANHSYKNQITGVYEKSPNYYFIPDYTTITAQDVDLGIYVGAIRTVFSNAVLSFDSTSSDYSLSIKADCYDVAAELNGTSRKLLTCIFAKTVNDSSITANPTFLSSSTIARTKTKILKGFYRGEVASWYRINEPTLNITVRKQWKNIPDDTPYEALIRIVDSDKKVIKTLTFNSQDGDQSQIVSNLAAYDINDKKVVYTIKEQIDQGIWLPTPDQSVVYPQNAVNFINQWNGVSFDGAVEIISKTYGNDERAQVSPAESGFPADRYTHYADLNNFLTGLDTDTEKGYWATTIKNKAESELPINSAKLYGCRYTYRYYDAQTQSTASLLEICPYIILVTNIDGEFIYYNFSFNIVDAAARVHPSGANLHYPYISASYSGVTVASTQLLWQGKILNSYLGQAVEVIAPRNTHVSGYTPMGNIEYCENYDINTGTGIQTKPCITIRYNNGKIQLSNFLILVYDRACAGIDTVGHDIGYVQNLYPYIYKCEITTPCRENSYGVITATVEYPAHSPNVSLFDHDSGDLYKYRYVANSVTDDLSDKAKYWYVHDANSKLVLNYRLAHHDLLTCNPDTGTLMEFMSQYRDVIN